MLVAADDIEFNYQLKVSETGGLDHVINFPNPFRGEGTNFVYSNEVEITEGNIDDLLHQREEGPAPRDPFHRAIAGHQHGVLGRP
jgi:hypothetical protein